MTGPVLRYEVTEADTAIALGSGDVPVLATPRLVAWLEAATCATASAAGLTPCGRTSVGTATGSPPGFPGPELPAQRSGPAVGSPDRGIVEVERETEQVHARHR